MESRENHNLLYTEGVKNSPFHHIEVNNCLIINPTDAQRLVHFFQETENGWQ